MPRRELPSDDSEASHHGGMYEHRNDIPDYTHYDFSDAPYYRSRSDSPTYHAEQLTQPEVIVRSWGIQEMEPGDWVLFKPSSSVGYKKSGVRQAAFDLTYEEVDEGIYQKQTYILAVQMDHAFLFMGIDSHEPEMAPAGSYLVLNCDKHGNPIIVNGRRDIFFYTQEDLDKAFDLIDED